MFDNCNTWLFPILWFIGAFILGYLLRLFIGQTQKKKDSERIAVLEAANQSLQANSGQTHSSGNEGVDSQELETLKRQLSDYELQVGTLSSQLNDARVQNEQLQAQLTSTSGAAVIESSNETEDLKRIEGIGPNVEKILNKSGINSWADLAATPPSKLRELLDQEGGRFQYLDPTSWPQQATLAREQKWQELETLQEELIGGVYYGPVGQYKDADDLKRIEGIGPRAEGLLNNSGIHTWNQLATTDKEKLKEILFVAGGRFKDIDPSSWPQQAELAAAGNWEELDKLQEELIGGEFVTDQPLSATITSGDDLKIIEGIGPKLEGILNEAGITSLAQLAETEPSTLREILAKGGDRYKLYNPDSWPEQAKLAVAGRWDQLDKLQEELIGGVRKRSDKDDLKLIEGIGPKIESLLNNAGIHTFEQLAHTDPNRLRELLDKADPRYRILKPNSWPNQARLAHEGKWNDLYDLQDELLAGRITNSDDLKQIEGIGPKVENLLQGAGINNMDQLAATDPTKLRSILDGGGNRYRFIDPASWPQQAQLAKEGKVSELNSLQEQLYAGAFVNPFETAVPDDLKRIEGIGPKIENLLNDEGITTWDDLANTSPEKLKAILDAAGNRYKMHDPTSWPEQAALARDSKWTELDELQEDLIGGIRRNPLAQAAPLAKDDLKKIEGIGPKIEGLLNTAGINTWKQLSETDTNRLKEILKAAGDRYRIHDPTSWPEQAGLAANGKWEELQQLQDELIGGKSAK